MSDVFFFKGKAYSRGEMIKSKHRYSGEYRHIERVPEHDAQAVEADAPPSRVQLFCEANDQHLVIAGHVIHWLESGGARYRLLNGIVWQLTREECRALPEGYPKWKLP